MGVISKKFKCRVCGAPSKYRKLRLCSKHYLKHRRQVALAKGICIRCGNNKVAPGLKICPTCSDANKKISAACKKRLIAEHRCRDCGVPLPPERRAHRCELYQSQAKKRRDLLRSQHRCMQCGTPLGDSRFTRCDHCRSQKSQNKRIHASLRSGNAGFDIDLRSGIQRIDVNDFLKHPEKYRPVLKKCSCGNHITTPEFAALGVCHKCYYKQSTAKPMDRHARKANRKFSA